MRWMAGWMDEKSELIGCERNTFHVLCIYLNVFSASQSLHIHTFKILQLNNKQESNTLIQSTAREET